MQSVNYSGGMARPRPPDMMDRLLAAATDVFAARGLSGARMSDVADTMGVAHGTVYTYVESKEALFALLVEQGADTGPARIPDELPVPAPDPETLLRRLRARIGEVFTIETLGLAIEIDAPEDGRAEFEAILGELYDKTYETRRQATVLERSAHDLPEFFQVFYLGVRRGLFDQLALYIAKRQASGWMRASLDPEIAARHVAETVTYFARHRLGDPDPPAFEEARSRADVIDLLGAALLAGNERRGD
jgi:AcrR family transcriptional regulator